MTVTNQSATAAPGDHLTSTVRKGKLYIQRDSIELGYVHLRRLGSLARVAIHRVECLRSHPTRLLISQCEVDKRLNSVTSFMGVPVCGDAGVCCQCGGYEDYLGDDIYACMVCM